MRLAAMLALAFGAAAAALPAQDPQPNQPQPDQPAATQPAEAQGSDNPFKPFDRAAYEAHATQLGATPAQLTRFGQEIEQLGAGRAGDNLMRALNPAYDAAVKLSEAGDPKAALELTKVLDGASDKTLQGHLRYHLARVFLDGDDPERAVLVLNKYVNENANLTPLDDEVVYFYAQSLAEVPMSEEALNLFRGFLEWFPTASERYRATAHQRAQELEGQLDSALHQLADGMKKVTRDLRKQNTGKPTQERQKDFVTKLDELIEMYEEMEKQGGGGSPSGNQQSMAPAGKSGLVEGEARIGNLEKRASVADRWGNMKDKDREKIESEVQNLLPPESRKMLEEYYKKLGAGGNQ